MSATNENALPRVAIVGRPNVGKSSLLNRLVGEERVMVSDVPGTTRDAVDLPFEFGGRSYIAVDTAGIKISTLVTLVAELLHVHDGSVDIDDVTRSNAPLEQEDETGDEVVDDVLQSESDADAEGTREQCEAGEVDTRGAHRQHESD